MWPAVPLRFWAGGAAPAHELGHVGGDDDGRVGRDGRARLDHHPAVHAHLALRDPGLHHVAAVLRVALGAHLVQPPLLACLHGRRRKVDTTKDTTALGPVWREPNTAAANHTTLRTVSSGTCTTGSDRKYVARQSRREGRTPGLQRGLGAKTVKHHASDIVRALQRAGRVWTSGAPWREGAPWTGAVALLGRQALGSLRAHRPGTRAAWRPLRRARPGGSAPSAACAGW